MNAKQFAAHRKADPHCTCNDCVADHAQACMWFAHCANAAVTTQAHPVLGDVPICQRCKDWYNRMSGQEVRQ